MTMYVANFCYINLLHLLFFGEGQVKVGVQQLNFSQFFITLSSSRALYFQLFHREQFGVKL